MAGGAAFAKKRDGLLHLAFLENSSLGHPHAHLGLRAFYAFRAALSPKERRKGAIRARFLAAAPAGAAAGQAEHVLHIEQATLVSA